MSARPSRARGADFVRRSGCVGGGSAAAGTDAGGYPHRAGGEAGHYGFIRQKVQAGEQAYLVCPLVEESERVEAKDAQATCGSCPPARSGPAPGPHLGQPPPAEKEEVIGRFSAGEMDVWWLPPSSRWGQRARATVMVIEMLTASACPCISCAGRWPRRAGDCFLGRAQRACVPCALGSGLLSRRRIWSCGCGDFWARANMPPAADAFGVGDMHSSRKPASRACPDTRPRPGRGGSSAPRAIQKHERAEEWFSLIDGYHTST